jgi:hypothetical protein
VLTAILLRTQIASAQTPGDVPVVTADAVTPNAGSGAIQSFDLSYTDSAGATDLRQTWVWFNPAFTSSAHSCLAYYQPGTNTLNLLDDAGTKWLSAPIGSGTLQNSQCAIALIALGSNSGNTLTFTLAVTFKAGFAGTHTIFMYATNGKQTSGWQTRGTWTVPAAATPVVTADSVTPNAGTGTTETFVLSYSDTAGATDLRQTWVWFNPTFSSSAHSCLAYYQPGTNYLNLLDDAGTTWLSAPLLGNGTLQNRQCAIALASTTAVPSGNTLTLTLAVTFKPAFAGTKTIFIYATNGTQTSGWQTRGSWTVPVPVPVTPVVTADSVTPNAGTGVTQTFVMAYGDTAGGTSDLQEAWIVFSPTSSPAPGQFAHSCVVITQPNLISLLDDDGVTVLSAPNLENPILQNSQCAIYPGNFLPVWGGTGNTVTLTLGMIFKPAFAGTKTIFMLATNGFQTSGWQTRGTWTVPVGAVITADSVTPNAGTGVTQTFGLLYSDTGAANDLRQAWAWFNPTFSSSAAHSCLVYYDLGTGRLNLLDDAGRTWLSAPLGSGTLQNSQCAIALASSWTASGGNGLVNTLTLALAMSFTPAFSGTQTIFMYATNGTQSSGWQARGTWTVSAGPVPVVTADTVTPNGGTGATQTFQLAYSDTAGAGDLQQTWVWFNPTFASSSAHSCLAYYQAGIDILNLLDDAGATWLRLPASFGTTLQNGQCTITLGTRVSTLNTLTVPLTVTFQPAFAGTQTIFMYATNGTQTSGWQTRGTWTVP